VDGVQTLSWECDVSVNVELGCPAATPMMVAVWQGQEALKILLGRGQLLRHEMLFMDAEAGTVEFLEIGS